MCLIKVLCVVVSLCDYTLIKKNTKISMHIHIKNIHNDNLYRITHAKRYTLSYRKVFSQKLAKVQFQSEIKINLCII